MKQVMARSARWGAIATVGFLAAQGAAAQSVGGVAYAPLAASNVPTVSEWALMGMAALLAAVAYYAMRSQGGRALKVWAVGLLACASLSAALWNRPAVAEPLRAEISLDQATGGVASIPFSPDLDFGDRFHIYMAQNLSGVPQRVTSVSVLSGLSLLTPDGFTPQCVAGLVLQPNEACYVRVYNSDNRG